MLLRLLELDADDWPMHKLLGVLGNNYFAPDWTDWNDRARRPGRAHDPQPANSPRPPAAAGAERQRCGTDHPTSDRKYLVAPLMECHERSQTVSGRKA